MKLIRASSTILFCLTALGAQARSIDDIKKDGKIVIATEGAYPPFNYYQGAKLTGFEIELGEAMARKLGVKVVWKALAMNALLPGLRHERWDVVIAGVTTTEERALAVTFADPHWCSGGVVVSRQPQLRGVKDLVGKTVGVQTGTTYFDNVKKIAGVKEVKNYPQDTDARAALLSGRVDAWVADKFVAKSALEAGSSGGLALSELLWVERNAPVVAKGNTGLAQAMNKALAEVQADGSYAAISQKYLKEDIRCH